MVPKKLFFAKGVGVHKDKLTSFEDALRSAGIEKFNLVYVSSIFPPNCKLVSKEEGLKTLSAGEIVFCVMARNETNEANKLIASSIGLAIPHNKKIHGYLSENHCFGQSEKSCGEYAEELACEMLATTLGIKVDSKNTTASKENGFKERANLFKTTHSSISAKSSANGFWTTTVSIAVMAP